VTEIDPGSEVRRPNVLRRRTLLTAAVTGGLLSVALPGVAAAASPIPKLPGELSRTTTATPRGVPYDNITVSIKGDKAMLFVPHSMATASLVGVIWYYHANGSSYSALNAAFKYGAELAVDQGAVGFCPNLGGSLWVNSAALTYHANAAAWLKASLPLGLTFMRSNSGGGAMMCWAYAKNLVPGARGMYLANSAYDMVDIYDRDTRVPPVYNNSRTAAQATNPAGLTGSVWKSKRIRVLVSDDAHPDLLLPPHTHGLALIAKSNGYALENSVKYHQSGHVIPSGVDKDMLSTFQRWTP
jgi:hypothetical protein